MHEQRQRIVEDLSGVFAGELAVDALSVAMFASDASWYQIEPLGVAFPKDRDDVIALAKYAAEKKIPLIPRGAGSSVTGGALGRGLIVDCSRHLTKIEQIGPDTVRVQPGVVLDDLNRVLREQGRYFPPDPSNPAITTIGSMLATDAAGSRSMRVGSTRDHVRSVEIVMAGGQCLELGNEPLETELPPKDIAKPAVEALLSDPLGAVTDGVTALAASLLGRSSDAGLKPTESEVRRGLVSRLARVLSENESLIREKQPPIPRNCSGYFLRGVLSRTHLHAARLLVGSEGTLGIFTSATLHTAPLPTGRGVALLFFASMDAAVEAVHALSDQLPSACDLLDRRLLTLAREADAFFTHIIPPTAEAALIVEQTGFSEAQARDRIRFAVETALRFDGHLAADAYDYDSVELLWSLPRKVVPHLNRVKGATRPQPFVEAIAVPPEKLREFLGRMQKVLQKHEVIASLYSHAAAGQIHLRPFLPNPTPADAPRLEAIARDLYQVVFDVGGTISGEHGDGLSRTSFLRSQYGSLYRVFQQVKDVFDPLHLMNPGKKVSDDPHLTVKNLRAAAAVGAGLPTPPLIELQLKWTLDELLAQAATCNGCGMCRSQSSDLRMCPFFRANSTEEASPRSKANIVRNFVTGQVSPQDFASSAMKRIADLCFNCKQCELECPANVNVSQMMIEAKAANVAEHGLDRAHWILSRAHSFGAIGCLLSWFVNRGLNNAPLRWLLERFVGIHRQRKLPTFARKPLLDLVPLKLTEYPQELGKDKPVVYFVDHFANYHDPELGQAFLAILEYNGVRVHVPEDQTVSGMAMISAGDLDGARKVAEQNVRELSELAREGVPIICTEPAAALCLKYEYPRLLDHPDVQVVADQVVEATAFLAGLLAKDQLRTDFGPLKLTASYHTPCHLKALHHGSPGLKLLERIPELEVFAVEKGCSGMAGAFGLTRENFELSLRIGHDLIEHMRTTDVNIGLTECSSCKMQMEQGTTIPTLHPIKLLALSYGLMPEIRARLQKATKKLVVT
ncbi:MAG: anaerobic glycerol-3-phosphate dehydrogenase subunit C [Planctomycetaceae bacterium]